MNVVPLSKWVDELESGARPKGGIKDGVGDILSLGAEHLSGDGGFNFKKTKMIPRDFFRSMKKGHIKKDDILIVKDGATTGKVSFVNGTFPFEEASINEHLFRLAVDSQKAFPAFVFRFLQSPAGQAGILSDYRGATVGGIGRTFVEKVQVPNIDPEEQRQIAAILDKADAIRRKREQALKLADDFLRSLFLDMFGDPLTNSKKLPTAPIKNFGKVVTGNTPPRKTPENYGTTIEWIKSDNINTPDHYLTEAEEHLSEAGMKIGRIVPAGSTLVTCIAGSPSVIGNASLANREVAFNQQINAVIPNSGTNPLFLYCQFLVGKTLIQANSTNSMKGMVSKGKFQEIHFLKPDICQQNDFGRLFKYYLKSREKLQDASIASQKLFGGLAQCAFRGEL